ncbi:MAG TPA: amidohydrolase family protein [Acidimicrobiales bacterium]|jgi:N-acyl-D-aspartate/D-glutamate deacylase|nr:amidohydrolase family protein [Acidimicrobiales bacterium]
MFDVLLRGGTVIDGTRMPRFRGDVGIKDGRIAAVGRLRDTDARRTIDADGLTVAPGYVDLHTHYDAQLFWDPYCSLSGWHGVTSVVIGNCGFGFAPVLPELRDRSMMSMTRNEAISLDAMRAGMPWDWVTFPEFLDSVERAPKSVNVLPYVPLTPLLVWVLGLERAKAGVLPTDAEHAELCRLLDEAMDAGACGWSAQRLFPAGSMALQRDYDGTPMPTDVMHDETCRVLAGVLARRGEGCIQMTLSSGDREADRRRFEEMAAISGRPVIYNVLGAVDRAPDSHLATIAWLEECRREGLRVYGQAMTSDFGFTFTLEDFNLFDDSDPWREMLVGTTEERLAKVRDPARRDALKRQLPYAGTAPLEGIVVIRAHAPDAKRFENHTVGDVGRILGKHHIDAFLDIAGGDDLRTTFYVDTMTHEIGPLRDIVGYRWAIPGLSDGGAHTKFATSGRYPTEFIVRLVREHGLCDLEEAHWRLAALPAMCAGFRDRGTLVEGAPADMIVYDYDNLRIRETEIVHDLPGGDWRRVQRADGYHYVLVNGEITIEHDAETGAPAGQLLRFGSGVTAAHA